MIDQDGSELQATAFQDQVDRIYECLNVQSLYLISGGIIKAQKDSGFQNHNSVTLVFDKFTKFEKVLED